MAQTIQSGLIWLDSGHKLHCKAGFYPGLSQWTGQGHINVSVYENNTHKEILNLSKHLLA